MRELRIRGVAWDSCDHLNRPSTVTKATLTYWQVSQWAKRPPVRLQILSSRVSKLHPLPAYQIKAAALLVGEVH